MEVDSGDGAPSGRDGSSAVSGNTNSEAQATGAGKDAPQGAKRPLSPGARGRATKDTWTEEDCGGEGHSFYNCVSAGSIIKTTGTTLEAVKNDGTLQAKGKGLRARLAAYIEAHAQRCRPCFTPNTGASQGSTTQEERERLLRVEDGEAPKPWEQYLKAVYRPKRYADEVAFRAASHMLGISLVLICGDTVRPSQVLHYHNSKSQIVIYLRHALGHYTLLTPKGELPDYAIVDSQPLVQDDAPRGSGGEEDVHMAVDDSWRPEERSIDDSEEEDEALPMPAEAQPLQKGAGPPRPARPPPKYGRANQEACQRRREACKNERGRYQWRCDVCRRTFTSSVFDNLKVERNNHIRRDHKGEDKSRFSKIPSAGLLKLTWKPSSKIMATPRWESTVRFWHAGQRLSHCARISHHLMPQEKEDDYVHALTSDGDVESNPGPSSALSCVSWNCQGKSKLYEALRLGALDAYDVVCLNESNFSAEDRCDFSKLVMQRGFHCYHGGGHEGHDTRGRRFARGGLVTMVKHGWASRLLRTAWCEGQYEWLGVQMDGFVLYNIHRKPGGDEALYTLEVQQLMGDYNRAVIVGDHNVHLGDYTVEGSELVGCTDDQGNPIPSRHDGDRCLDYAVAKNVTTVLPEYPARSGRSDHKAFGFFVCGERQAKETLYRLRPTTCYDRPDTISAKEWTERQVQHWRVRPVPTDEGDTEKEWQWFNATAEHAMREAMRGHGPPRDPPDRRPKGALISFVKADRRASECDPSSHKLRRLINLQGRLRECVRQSERGQPYFACLENARKSWPLWLGPVSDWTQLFELLTTVDAALLQVGQKEALAGIHKWQRQMAARGKKATQWLKGKSRPADFVVAEGDRVAFVTASLKNLETF